MRVASGDPCSVLSKMACPVSRKRSYCGCVLDISSSNSCQEKMMEHATFCFGHKRVENGILKGFARQSTLLMQMQTFVWNCFCEEGDKRMEGTNSFPNTRLFFETLAFFLACNFWSVDTQRKWSCCSRPFITASGFGVVHSSFTLTCCSWLLTMAGSVATGPSTVTILSFCASQAARESCESRNSFRSSTSASSDLRRSSEISCWWWVNKYA